MAKIILEGKEKEIKDGEAIKETCRDLGVPFGCESGVCQTCRIVVLEGNSNLDPKNETEEGNQLPDNERLACQCRIKSGIVKIKLAE